ncbi:hypothetical protein TUM12370_17630 [Salmonella enterica subsp. enterica serovar Choleraesuis]|nr:hypothetical protein TUM12370_17630 [Salmonella enterica subsp. enterica serovar Choleraesuis]
MEFFYVAKASQKSGKPNAIFWFTAKTEARAKLQAQVTLEDAGIETGRGQDYNNPVRTDFPVVDDLPEEGEVDFTWCDRYELQDDGRTWLPVAALASAPDADDDDEPVKSHIIDSFDPLIRMSFRTQLLAQYLSADAETYHVNKEQRAAISELEMDTDNTYIQNLLLAVGNFPEIKNYKLDGMWKLTDAVKKIWPPYKKAPELGLMVQFLKAWVGTEHIDRGLLLKDWVAGGRPGAIQRTDVKTAAGGSVKTDRNPDVTHTLDVLDIEIACALLPMDFNIHELPGGIYRRAKEMVTSKESPWKEWSKLLRSSTGILDVNRAAIFNLIRLAPENIHATPAAHLEYVNRTLTEDFSRATELLEPAAPAAEPQPEFKKVAGGLYSIDGLMGSAPANDNTPPETTTEATSNEQMETAVPGEAAADTPVSKSEDADGAPAPADAITPAEILAAHCPEIVGAIEADANQNDGAVSQIVADEHLPEPETAQTEPEPPVSEPAPEYPAYFEPGRYEGIPNEVYHAANGISSTQVKDARVSLMYFHGRHIARTIKRDSSDALTFGSLVHTLALEPETFDSEYAVFPGIPDNAFTTTDSLKAFIREYNADKPKAEQLKLTGKKEELQDAIRAVSPEAIFADEFEQQWRDSVTGKTILTADQLAAATTIQQALFSHPTAGKLLQHPSRAVESSYFGMDEETGLEVRVRPDLELSLDGVRIGLDLKTISMGKVKQDALRARLHREIIDRDYHVSAGMYCNVADFDQFFWIFVNKDDGHHWVAVIEASKELLDLGLLEYQKTMCAIASAMDTGIWPAPITDDYTDELNDFDLRRLEALRLA